MGAKRASAKKNDPPGLQKTYFWAENPRRGLLYSRPSPVISVKSLCAGPTVPNLEDRCLISHWPGLNKGVRGGGSNSPKLYARKQWWTHSTSSYTLLLLISYLGFGFVSQDRESCRVWTFICPVSDVLSHLQGVYSRAF